MSDCPKIDQEVEIKYKITNYKNEIIDSTEGKPNFIFTLGKLNIIKSISNALLTMTKGSKKIIDINIEQEPNIFDVIPETEKDKLINEKKIDDKYKIIKCEIELIDFYDKIKSVFELTNEEKYEKAKNLKLKFVEEYKQKKYKEGISSLDESLNFVEKISKEFNTEEIQKFKLTLMLNKCNCFNNLKEYPSTVKLSKEIIKMEPNSVKAYYYLGNSLAYLDEFDEARENYNKLYELMPDKKDPGVVALNELINTRKKNKENHARKQFKAFLAQNKDN